MRSQSFLMQLLRDIFIPLSQLLCKQLTFTTNFTNYLIIKFLPDFTLCTKKICLLDILIWSSVLSPLKISFNSEKNIQCNLRMQFKKYSMQFLFLFRVSFFSVAINADVIKIFEVVSLSVARYAFYNIDITVCVLYSMSIMQGSRWERDKREKTSEVCWLINADVNERRCSAVVSPAVSIRPRDRKQSSQHESRVATRCNAVEWNSYQIISITFFQKNNLKKIYI